MSPTIYKSHIPDFDLGSPGGLFTYTFNNSHLYDDAAPAFIDALTDERYSRGEFRELALRFGYAVKKRGAKRGDVAMVFSYVVCDLPADGCHYQLSAAGAPTTLTTSPLYS